MKILEFDTVILGGGPAGFSAGLYASRGAAKTAIVDISMFGGQPSNYLELENYPGFSKIGGYDLMEKFEAHADMFGVQKFPMQEIESVDLISNPKIIKTKENEFHSKTVIIATGAKPMQLGVKGEKEFVGRGGSYCAVCDGAFYKGKHVAVVGGGNTGIINALALADMCEKVYLIQDKDKLTGEKILQDKLKQKVNVEVITNSVVSKIIGDDKLEKIIIKNGKKENEIIVDGMFISIGLMPQSDFLKGIIDLDKFNYAVSFDTKTKIDGIFVAGDIRTKPFRQITTAVNDGTTSALYALEYLDN